MSQTLLEMTKDLVLAQIHSQHLTPESIHGALHRTYDILQHLDSSASGGENGHGQAPAPSLEARPQVDWKGSITRHAIHCLECGETFKQLSLRHLSVHDLDPRSYRAKYGIPRTQSLSARDVTARRRELAQQIRPWELAPSKQQATSKTQTPPKGPAKAAKPAAPAAKGAKATPRTQAKKKAVKS